MFKYENGLPKNKKARKYLNRKKMKNGCVILYTKIISNTT